MCGKHFLDDLLNPKSISVYGANNMYGTTMGTMLLMNIIATGYKGKIFPIHLRLDEVLGHKAYKTIAEVPEVPELVIIVLPPRVVPQIFKECGEKGVKNIVLISGGFRELSDDRENDLTEQITQIADQYGIRFIGPNCLGFYNRWIYPEDDDAGFNMIIFAKQPNRGKFSIASQSGTMSSHIFLDPESLSVSMGKSISVGNEANIDLVDFIEYFKEDEHTNTIGLYIEEIKRGQEFIEIAKRVNLKKPIIALYAGGSGAGNRAISSHTGSMAGDSRIFDAMVKETGIIKTNHVRDFLDLASICTREIFPKGNRIGIITNSGGPGALIANSAERIGLEVPIFSDELQSKLSTMLPHTASWLNPIDCTFDMNMNNFYVVFPKLLMKSGEIDLIILYGAIGFQNLVTEYKAHEKLNPYLNIRNDLAKHIDVLDNLFIKPTQKASKRHSVPIFYINPQNPNSRWSSDIRKQGGILFQYWDAPVRCAKKICDYAEFRRNLNG